LSQTVLDKQPETDWKAIKGFREIVAYPCDNMDMQIVWNTVEKLPSFRLSVEAMLVSLPPDEVE
jgi:uncharacterized protein with HEPN domain